MIVIRLACLVLLSAALLASTPAVARPTIDLDQPGALAALERANPAHYAKVTRILRRASRHPDSDVPRWARVAVDARDVDFAPIVLTSFPAKRRLSFALDDTRYVAVIVLTHLHGDVVPLK
jgi:hypothetical protein